MTQLLNIKQVQETLNVDRITVYRMLQDGRLRGAKVGAQWRIDPAELDRVLAARSDNANDGFPVHCAQTIQDLLSGVSERNACILDTKGKPITVPTQTYGNLIDVHAKGFARSWKNFVEATPGASSFEYPSGVFHAAAPVHDRGQCIAWVLIGCVNRSDQKTAPDDSTLPTVSREMWKRMQHWADVTAQALESILSERAGFIHRLQRISDLTQIP